MNEFETKALAGDWRAASMVLSRAHVRPEVLAALMTPDAHLEVVLGVLGRQDVTPEHLAWAATFDNALILGRVVSNPKTPTSLVREIRDRVADRDAHIWIHLREYAARVLDRTARDSGLHGG
ncbi:hypothetical protein FQP90_13520 [Paenarthrobacter nitroguajacolicus]|uniref:HEAT repeat domain-containing protein n=1 Tax=Paenarthrobacter nitroguajacolicus TaxID=211146 RepID=A0A558GXF2_PAENT|nr:hypothetical protein [Paenarthrobacter nitroguajacolicus]TVU61554.1 hypothetical protein FQP90_13520 [Paenarthrobacter nitroguajacolicus]